MKKLLILISLSIFLTGCGYTNNTTPDHSTQDRPASGELTTSTLDNPTTTLLDEHVRTGPSNSAGRRDLSLPNTDDTKTTIVTTTEIIEEGQKEEDEAIETTTFIIDGTHYSLPYAENMSVYDAMMTLATMSSHAFSFQAKEYSGLGIFVYEINGKAQDNKAGKYWIYYINNESAKIGISNYIIQQGDIIEWKYENTNF